MGLFGKSSTVYIPGCITFFKYREFYDLYQRIFNKLGIKFRILEKQRCCGLAALEAGYDAEARKLARENMDMLKQEDIKSIITTSPDCYKMLLQDYPKFLPDWNTDCYNLNPVP